jgi:chemotaxis protein MotB
MAEKKAMIVIKKITVVAGGAHGGAWKVAFADFMTAMMAFFLVMWLLATQSEQTKKAVSDYFSTPSVIEYEFNNYGVELTLEKLFMDLVNEPLKVFQAFVNPMDRTPNVMAMGMKKVVSAHLASQLGEIASNVNVTPDTIVFEIPDLYLFKPGTTMPSAQFVSVMDKVKGITTGLQDSDIQITSLVYDDSVYGNDSKVAKNVAEERLTIVELQIKGSLEHESVGVSGSAVNSRDQRGKGENQAGGGHFKIEIRQRPETKTGKPPRSLEDGVFGGKSQEQKSYNDYINKLAEKKPRRSNQRGTASSESKSENK